MCHGIGSLGSIITGRSPVRIARLRLSRCLGCWIFHPNTGHVTTRWWPPTIAAIFAAFKKRTGKAPDAQFVATGADLVDLIQAALLKAGDTNGTKVRDAFASLKNVKATSGVISYAGAPLYHNPKKNIFILKWDPAKRKPICVESFYPKVVPKIK